MDDQPKEGGEGDKKIVHTYALVKVSAFTKMNCMRFENFANYLPTFHATLVRIQLFLNTIASICFMTQKGENKFYCMPSRS